MSKKSKNVKKLLPMDSDWTFEKIELFYSHIERIGKEYLGLDIYPNQIEVISAEQMLDAYSSSGLPINYDHWSFGKSFLENERMYKNGQMGLAYEIVLNTSPCIAYLMEENTMAMQTLVMAHACVDADTEYLSPTGWKRIADYDGKLVGQYNADGTMNFVKPIQYVVNEDVTELNEFKTKSVHQRLSDDHRVVYVSHENNNLKIKPFSDIKKMHESKTRGFHGKFLNTFIPNINTKLSLSDDELRLQVAIIADGNLTGNHIRFHLKKDRKISRLEFLLNKLGIVYDKISTYGGRFSIRFDALNKFNTVEFDNEFYKASLDQLKIIAEEVLLWDGSIPKKGSPTFATTSKSSADFIQYVFSCTGNRASIKKYQDKRPNKKLIYNVTKTNTTYSGISGGRSDPCDITKYKTKDNKSYCFTVPSGMLVLRCMDYVFVTGNCIGHNAVFKNNYLFKQWTQADAIVDYMSFAKNFIKECEERHGADAVESILDSCHALMNHGVDQYKRSPKMSKEEQEKYDNQMLEYIRLSKDVVFDKTLPVTPSGDKVVEKDRFPVEPEENLLYFFEKYSPILEPWQREIIRIVRKIAQYFYPQRLTKVLNEGYASFCHYIIMNKMYDEGLIDDSFMLEFLSSHTNVVYQPTFDSKHYSGINPYALGFAIFMDIKRMCENPTEEDYKWFPDLAGKDWKVETKYAMANFKDESFIQQYLSPKVIRDLKLFSVLDTEKEQTFLVEAIHDDDGYKTIIEHLSEMHNLLYRIPQLSITNTNYKTNRHLEISHDMSKGVMLDPENVRVMLNHIMNLWGFEVILNEYDKDGWMQNAAKKETD